MQDYIQIVRSESLGVLSSWMRRHVMQWLGSNILEELSTKLNCISSKSIM
jgi:hypothetical protein